MSKNVEDTCKDIERYFYLHKPIKKKIFFTFIKSLSIFFRLYNYTNPEIRSKIFRLIYLYFREIDDIIDGDKILKTTNNNFYEYKKIVTEYMYNRRAFLQNEYESSPLNELDGIMKSVLELTNELNLDLRNEFMKLLDCMFFDLERKCDLKNGQIYLSSRSDIDKYFFQYYYDSCIKIAIMLTIPEHASLERKNIKDLGYAQRIYFNLEDFFEDLSHGIINIPKQDIESFQISEQSLITIAKLPNRIINLCKKRGFNNPEVSKFIDEPVMFWLEQQLNLGIGHLRAYQENAKLRTVSSISKELLFQRNDFSEIILRFGIERGTDSYLSKLERQLVKKI